MNLNVGPLVQVLRVVGVALPHDRVGDNGIDFDAGYAGAPIRNRAQDVNTASRPDDGVGAVRPQHIGTGTEDYFCGAYDFDIGIIEKDHPGGSAYVEFTTPYAGLPQVLRPDGVYKSQQRFGMYRWHIMDPIRFEQDLRVTMQALGWRTHKDRQYLPLQDDIASVAYWYQTLPTAPFPSLPDRDYLEVI